jgi:glutaredoxin 3
MQSVEIYTGNFCGYCTRAKQLLSQKGVSFIEHQVGRDPGKRAEMVQRSLGGRSVPQIFVGGRHVGGYRELYALDRSGKLDPMLAS